jgi:formylglycine-generating enzyme required for sulfatase activity
MEFVELPGGEFWMGSTSLEVDLCVQEWAHRLLEPGISSDEFRNFILKEYPKHPLRVPAISIGIFPVTNRDFGEYLREQRAPSPESIDQHEPADHPVWGVSYEQATAYCHWLGRRLDAPCRLPTEAEWEYAARGPSGRGYPFGQTFDAELCNTFEAGIGHTTPVHHYRRGASEFGVYDLAGNVEEWTSDYYAAYPGGIVIEDEIARSLGRYRVLRGGSFARGGDLARCARRHGPHPSPAYRYRGFRVVIEHHSPATPVWSPA